MDKSKDINIENNAKWRECYVSIKDVVHKLYCEVTEDGMLDLYLDGRHIVEKKYSVVRLKGFDHAVEIEGKTIHCVFDEEKLDVAVDGRFLKSKRNYIPLKAAYISWVAAAVLFPVILVLASISTMKIPAFVLTLALVASVNMYYRYMKGKKYKEKKDVFL